MIHLPTANLKKDKEISTKVVVGDPSSQFSLEGRIKLGVVSGNPIEVPYTATISAEDILYAHFRAGNYAIVTNLIHDSFERLKKKMKSWEPSPMQGGMSAALAEMGYAARFVSAAKEGSKAFIEMYKQTGNKDYINEATNLLNKLLKTKGASLGSDGKLGDFIRYALFEKSGYSPQIRGVLVKAHVKEGHYEGAMEFAKGYPQLERYVRRYGK